MEIQVLQDKVVSYPTQGRLNSDALVPRCDLRLLVKFQGFPTQFSSTKKGQRQLEILESSFDLEILLDYYYFRECYKYLFIVLKAKV